MRNCKLNIQSMIEFAKIIKGRKIKKDINQQILKQQLLYYKNKAKIFQLLIFIYLIGNM